MHIGDGISEGTQVDMVPNYIKLSQEKIPINAPEVEGIELKDRTIIFQKIDGRSGYVQFVS